MTLITSRDIKAKTNRLIKTVPELSVFKESGFWVADLLEKNSTCVARRMTQGLSTREMYYWLSAFEEGRSVLYMQMSAD